MLRAALRRAAEGGAAAATMKALAADIGAPSGSVYHRFASREVLLATLWLELAEQFQAGFLETLAKPGAREAGRSALTYTLDWCRSHPLEARVLLMQHREDYLGTGAPADLERRARELTEAADAGLKAFARRQTGSSSAKSLRRVVFALVDLPIAAGRRYLAAGTPPPADVDELVLAAYDAIFPPVPARSGARATRSK